MKIGAGVLELKINKSFRLNLPIFSLQAPDPWVKVCFNILGVNQIFVLILEKREFFFH